MIGLRVVPADMRDLPLSFRMDLLVTLSDKCRVSPRFVMAADLFCEDDGSITIELHLLDIEESKRIRQFVVGVRTFEKFDTTALPSSIVERILIFGVPVNDRLAFGNAPIPVPQEKR